jgi:hypothetical protein
MNQPPSGDNPNASVTMKPAPPKAYAQ